MAVKTLAIRPIVKVMAKPRIGPVPNRNKKNAETTVVTCVSMIVRNALSNPCSTAAAGVFAAAQIVESDGINLGHGASADDIAAHFSQIADWSSQKHYGQGGEQSAKFLARVQEKPLLG